MSAAIALIWLAASEEVADSELCASRAVPRMEAAVSAPTAVNVRSTSIASDLTWLAASVDAVISVFCASRAPVVIDFGGGVAGHRQRTLDVGGQRLDLAGCIGGRGHQRALGLAAPPR